MTSAWLTCGLCLAALAGSGPARAAVRFDISFDDPGALHAAYYGELQQGAEKAGNAWATRFAAPEGPLTLSVQISFADIATATGRSLTSAYLDTTPSGLRRYEQGAAYELRTGIDPNADLPDIEFVFGIGGYLQQELWFDPQPGARRSDVPGDRTDAQSVLLHEYGHAFGFNGWRDGSTGALPGDYLSSFDALVEWRATPAGLAPYFTGAAASLAYGGAVPLTDANYGHLGGWNAGAGADLMPDLMNGMGFDRGARYSISALDHAILQDLGLPMLAPVPEPGTAALILLGLAAVALRRRA